MRTFYKSILCLLLCLSSSVVAKPRPLKIADIKDVAAEMLYYHVENRSFNPVIVRRSFKIYIEQFDFEKIYFIHSEIQNEINLSNKKATSVIKNVRRDDFSNYFAMDSKIQKAIVRAQNIRQKHIKEILAQGSLDIHAIDLYEPSNTYPTNERELESKIKRHLLFLLKIDAYDQGFTRLNSQDLDKELNLIDRKMRKHENTFLYKDPRGRNLSKAKIENLQATHILKSIAKSLDAHTAFFSPQEATSMRTSLQKQFKGIGVVIREGIQGAYIADLIPNGPAAKSKKVQIGDVLLQVNGKNVQDVPFEEVLEALNKTRSSKVTLVLQRHDKEKPPELVHVKLKKEVIVMEEDRISYTYEHVGNGIIGKIDMSSFYDNMDGITAEKDLRAAIRELKKKGNLKGVVLDFRNNSGGFLTQAVKVAGLFITRGVIVISKYANGEMQYSRDIDGRNYYEGPLVVLTSKASASAAEVVAQALQDYGVALIVGDERTYGKGSMQYQNITDERAEAFFKVTVGRYYTISGRSTQINGVQADIIVPTKYAPFNIGERYLQYPLSADNLGFSFLEAKKGSNPKEMFSSYFPKPENKWRSALPLLKQNSEVRLKNSKNFQAFLKQVNAIKEGHVSSYDSNYGNNDLQMNEAVNIVKDMIQMNN